MERKTECEHTGLVSRLVSPGHDVDEDVVWVVAMDAHETVVGVAGNAGVRIGSEGAVALVRDAMPLTVASVVFGLKMS